MSYNLHVRHKPPRSKWQILLLWLLLVLLAAAVAYVAIHGLPHNLFHRTPPKPVVS